MLLHRPIYSQNSVEELMTLRIVWNKFFSTRVVRGNQFSSARDTRDEIHLEESGIQRLDKYPTVCYVRAWSEYITNWGRGPPSALPEKHEMKYGEV
jgi:hypothetical protein